MTLALVCFNKLAWLVIDVQWTAVEQPAKYVFHLVCAILCFPSYVRITMESDACSAAFIPAFFIGSEQ